MKLFTRFVISLLVLCFLTVDVSYGQLPGQIPLKPNKVPQFVDPLPHFAGLRIDASSNMVITYAPVPGHVAVSTGTKLATGTVGLATPDVGKAKFWGYSISNDGGNTFTPPHWPAFTIVAQKGVPVHVEYRNELYGETYASVNLIADQSIHWADPLNEMPNYTPPAMNMNPYTGPVPVSPHLHGGEVASESDGGPDSWFTPDKAITGPSWDKGVNEFYDYPNDQEAATVWYHDHALGVTRLNVYAGLAGFYFIKGPEEEDLRLPGWSGDGLVQEVAPVGKSGVFRTVPYLPEIEIAFQDRMFDINGGLYFPNLPPNAMDHPFWTPEFVGDIITVNGKTWPFLSVAPRKYRFRLLNGSNARFYQIWLQDLVSGAMGPQIVQIGTDGGLLNVPVPIVGKLLLAPGERADVIIDFTASAPNQVWTLRNSAKTPFPNGAPASAATTGRLMQFVVNGINVGSDNSQIPARLRASDLPNITTLTPDVKRQLTLNEVMGMGGPLEILVNNTKWIAPVTENPTEGTTEFWQIINLTADAHPIHLHLVQFQLVSRQAFNLKNYNLAYNAAFPGDPNANPAVLPGVYMPGFGPPLPYNTPNTTGAVGGNPDITPFLTGPVKPPAPNEMGWKDTYIVYPGEIATFAIRFMPTDTPLGETRQFAFDPGSGPGYVWHCHIIDHEDNEMMRPYKVERLTAKGGLTPAAVKAGLSPIVADQLSEKINGVVLEQNYPNPFSGETEIRFTLPEPAHVRMTLFNSAGDQVSTILDANAPAGLNTVRLDAGKLKAGIYYYQLKTGAVSQVKKIVVQN